MRSARLPGLDRADLVLQTERARAAARRHPQRRRGRAGRRVRGGRAWSVAASRISSNMSSRLLQAAPSAPSDTEMPRARISATGAMPDPSFRFDPGQCRTLTSRSAISACSASSTQTQCAAQSRRVARPVSRQVLEVACAAREASHDLDLVLRFRRVRVDEHVVARAESAATASSSSREQETANRGANAARSRPLAAPSQRRCKRDALVDRLTRSLAQARRHVVVVAESIMHFPTVARMPLAASVSNTTSVSCTVSIVSTVVVPERSSSAAARRVAARSVAGVCAASSGQTRRRSQSSSGKSSAKRRKSVWHRWTCVCTNPGRT